jgi:hypothetical protein
MIDVGTWRALREQGCTAAQAVAAVSEMLVARLA